MAQSYATPAVQPILNKTRIAGGQVIFKAHGSDSYVNLGIAPTVEFTPNLEEYEQYTQEFGDRRLAGTWAVTKDGSVSMTLESWTETTFAALFMSEIEYVTQAANPSPDPIVIMNAKPGDIVRIPGVNSVVTAITDGDTESLTLGTHYTHHAASGFAQFLSLPASFGPMIEINYTVPEITVADGMIDLGVMSSGGIRGELSIVNVIGDGNPGVGSETIFWDVEFRPSGAVNFFNTQSAQQAPLTGRVYATSNHGVRKAYGQVRSFGKV